MPGLSNMFKNNEKVIKIQREENGSSLLPSSSPLTSAQQQQQQQETRSWSQSTFSTKRVVQSSDSPEPVITQHSSTTKSSDLFSNKHDDTARRGSNTSTTSNNSGINKNTTSQMKSSSLVSKALQEFEDDVQNMTEKNEAFNKTNSSSRRSSSQTSTKTVIPSSTPTMEIVPSGGGMSPGWRMGTDANAEVPLTYEIVTRTDGKKEFQLLVTTRDFSPEDLQVKLTDNTLTISGKHEEKSPTGAFSAKSFYRTCTIPSGVRPEDLNCSLDSCGRLKITAPVPDVDPSSRRSSATTKMITKQKQSSNQQWHEDGNVPSGFKISPGEKEQVMTVFNNDFDDLGNGIGGMNVGNSSNNAGQTTHKTVSSTTKTVKTFKTVT